MMLDNISGNQADKFMTLFEMKQKVIGITYLGDSKYVVPKMRQKTIVDQDQSSFSYIDIDLFLSCRCIKAKGYFVTITTLHFMVKVALRGWTLKTTGGCGKMTCIFL